MDNAPRPSFIPKSPVQGVVKRPKVRRFYILTFIVQLFFIGTLIGAGAVWFLSHQVTTKIDQTKVTLEKARTQFNQHDLFYVEDFSHRLDAARTILNSGIDLPRLFAAIESATANSVTFSGFSYNHDQSDQLTFSATADVPDLNTVRFEKNMFASNTVLSKAVFSNVMVTSAASNQADPTAMISHVTFSVTSGVDQQTLGINASSTDAAASTGGVIDQATTSPSAVPADTTSSMATSTPGTVPAASSSVASSSAAGG